MGIKQYKPTSPGRRFITGSDFEEVTHRRARSSSLLGTDQARAAGATTTAASRAAQRRRPQAPLPDHRLQAREGRRPGQGRRIEYDPNRSARIALLHYADGEKRYILAPQRLGSATRSMSGPGPTSSAGNALPLREHPAGTHDPQHRAAARPRRPALPLAPASAPSSWPRKATTAPCACPPARCAGSASTAAPPWAQVGNSTTRNITVGKAGRSRWKGMRPDVRGSAMNPVDHPHGGGEGKTTGPPPGHAVGQARPTATARATRASSARSTSSAAASAASTPKADDRWVAAKKGPFVDDRLMKRIEDMNTADEKRIVRTWSRSLDDLPGDGRAHDRDPRRPQARARVHLREHGRPQARRVRAHPHLSGPRRLRPTSTMRR